MGEMKKLAIKKRNNRDEQNCKKLYKLLTISGFLLSGYCICRFIHYLIEGNIYSMLLMFMGLIANFIVGYYYMNKLLK